MDEKIRRQQGPRAAPPGLARGRDEAGTGVRYGLSRGSDAHIVRRPVGMAGANLRGRRRRRWKTREAELMSLAGAWRIPVDATRQRTRSMVLAHQAHCGGGAVRLTSHASRAGSRPGVVIGGQGRAPVRQHQLGVSGRPCRSRSTSARPCEKSSTHRESKPESSGPTIVPAALDPHLRRRASSLISAGTPACRTGAKRTGPVRCQATAAI